jgi:hypothetical protein
MADDLDELFSKLTLKPKSSNRGETVAFLKAVGEHLRNGQGDLYHKHILFSRQFRKVLRFANDVELCIGKRFV